MWDQDSTLLQKHISSHNKLGNFPVCLKKWDASLNWHGSCLYGICSNAWRGLLCHTHTTSHIVEGSPSSLLLSAQYLSVDNDMDVAEHEVSLDTGGGDVDLEDHWIEIPVTPESSPVLSVVQTPPYPQGHPIPPKRQSRAVLPLLPPSPLQLPPSVVTIPRNVSNRLIRIAEDMCDASDDAEITEATASMTS